MHSERVQQFMRQFPAEEQIHEMPPEELGPHVLRALLRGSSTNRYNFANGLPSGQIADRFMEAWSWLEREGFIANKANDSTGQNFFVTRAGQSLAEVEDFEAWRNANVFPEGLDPVIARTVKPLFVRGDYDTAVFRAFKEVEVRLRKKHPSLNSHYGVDLMNHAFGDKAAVLMTNSRKDRQAARELFAGAFAFCRNPSAHHEVKFEDPREVADMICFANQLLRIVARI